MSTLTDTEKAQIRSFLGYAQFYRFRNAKLESALDLLDPASEPMIRTEIAAILAVDAAINGTTRTVAGIAQADDARFYSRSQGDRFSALRREGRMHVARISRTLDVPIYRDFDWFAGGSSAGSCNIGLG